MKNPLLASVEQFLQELIEVRNLSPHTYAAYRRDLRKFTDFCTERGMEELCTIPTEELRLFSAALHRSGMSANSIRRCLSALRSLYAWLIRKGLAHENPVQDVRAPKSERKLPHALDPDQAGHLLAATGKGWLAVRDRAMMELLYSSGLRLTELVRLDLDDFSPDHSLVQVLGKGNKSRIVPVGQMAQSALAEWLECRSEISLRDTAENALFLSRRGRRIHPRSVQMRIAAHGAMRDLPQGIHPHMLRHSCATHLLESSGNLRMVQEFLGHSAISTTQIYTHLDFQHLARTHEKSHPRARRKKRKGTPPSQNNK